MSGSGSVIGKKLRSGRLLHFLDFYISHDAPIRAFRVRRWKSHLFGIPSTMVTVRNSIWKISLFCFHLQLISVFSWTQFWPSGIPIHFSCVVIILRFLLKRFCTLSMPLGSPRPLFKGKSFHDVWFEQSPCYSLPIRGNHCMFHEHA